MPTPVLVTICAIVAAALGIAAIAVWSRLYFKRSLMATLAEWYLRLTEKRLPDEQVRAELWTLPKHNDVPLSAPKRYMRKLRVEKRLVEAMQVFTFYGSENPSKAVLYLHGAGYVRPPRKQHWRFAFKLAQATGAAVVFAVYPKAPKHTFKESYALITKLYEETRARYEKTVLAGDSSGGGLALGLARSFAEMGIKEPDEIVLLSPWLDITLSHPDIPRYEKVDPIVFVSNDRIWGESWAGEADLKDPKVSPIYGEFTGLPPVTVFVGTREALYPDVMKFAGEAKKQGAEIRVYIGGNLNHVYPIFPIPEARKTLKIISEIVCRDVDKGE